MVSYIMWLHNLIVHDNYTRIFVIFNNYSVFILDKTTEVVIGIIFRSVNVIGENICIATWKFVAILSKVII